MLSLGYVIFKIQVKALMSNGRLKKNQQSPRLFSLHWISHENCSVNFSISLFLVHSKTKHVRVA